MTDVWTDEKGEYNDEVWNNKEVEICRINADGTTSYNWDVITTKAAKWSPSNSDIGACIAKLLLPFKPKEAET